MVTWSGGCGAVQKSDWSPLKGRDITLWPDHDHVGRNAVHKIADILQKQGEPTPSTSIKIVDLPTELPHKWDLADPLPKDFQRNDLNELLQKTNTITVEKTCEPTVLSPKHVEKIDAIMKENSLNLSFGALSEKDYQNIHHTMEAFKTLNKSPHHYASDDMILKRSTFMVCYLKDQIHHTNFAPDETQKLALIASKQFADQHKPGTLASNSDAHFKARTILRTQERLDQHQLSHQRDLEKSGTINPSMDGEKSTPKSSTITQSENHLNTLIQRINNDYRKDYDSQQLQQMQERQLRMMKDRGMER